MPDMRPIRETFPVNMLLQGRQVLVVGGGRVGQRKVELLLEADTRIRLVCPECVAELSELAEAGRIDWRPRRFEVGDLAGQGLVFACTDDKLVNRQILTAARAAGVLCCCADGNWADGDFTTPAILRTNGLLIAISTSGRSCRQAKLVKDNLLRHIGAIASTDLIVLGTSHEQLGLQAREGYHLPLPERERIGEMVRQIWGVHEFLILNTCNRVEILAAVSREAGTSGILRRLMRFDLLDEGDYYLHRGFDAFAHLCEVAAGMRSQVPGEFHIVSQLKDAVEEAQAFGWAGPVIREWCDVVLRASKAVRQATEELLEVAEIEEVCQRWIDAEMPELAGAPAMVIGSGQVGRGLVERLLARGCRCLWMWHVNRPVLPPEWAGRVGRAQMARIAELVPRVRFAVSAVDVREPVVGPVETAAVAGELLLVDLGIPRNIDPALEGRPGMRVVDLDTLKNWYRRETGSIDRAWAACSAVIGEHRESYERIRSSIQGDSL